MFDNFLELLSNIKDYAFTFLTDFIDIITNNTFGTAVTVCLVILFIKLIRRLI